jgi:hypothetical protein
MNLRIAAILATLIIATLFIACTPDTGPSEGDEETVVTSVAEIEPHVIPDPTEGLELGDPELGREYFYGENRGRCLTCHTLAGEGFEGGYALDDIGLQREAEWLAILLDNPRRPRPELAIMPPYRGDSGGATIADIVQFLLIQMTPVEHPETTDVLPESEPEPNHDSIGKYGDDESDERQGY